jgi:nucleoid DNA-binding protein
VELIKTLADDCEITRARAQDILTALRDIIAERLIQKECVTIPDLGSFEIIKWAERPFRFRMAPALQARLGLEPKIHVAACVECGNEPPVAGRRRGRKCLNERERKRKRKERLAARNAKGAM